MQPYQLRVVEEKTALDEKLTNLGWFIGTSEIFAELPDDEKERLRRQANVMEQYSVILGERIDAFPASEG